MLIHYFLSLITLWVRLENIWEVALVMAWHHLLHLSKWVSQPWETETQALLSINRPLKGGKRRKVHKMTVRKKKSSNEIVVNFHIISRNSKYLFNFFVEVKHILESKKIIKIEMCLMHICKYVNKKMVRWRFWRKHRDFDDYLRFPLDIFSRI